MQGRDCLALLLDYGNAIGELNVTQGIDERSGLSPDTDVLVVGGGAVSVATAVTAARQDAQVSMRPPSRRSIGSRPRAISGADLRARLNRDGARLD